MITHQQQSQIYYIFRAITNASSAALIVRQVMFYEQVHGLRWMVQRYKQHVLDLVSGMPQPIKRRRGLWTGPMRPVHRLALKSERGMEKAINALKFISLFKAKVTKQDYLDHQKFLDGLEPPIHNLTVSPFRRRRPVKIPWISISFRDLQVSSSILTHPMFEGMVNPPEFQDPRPIAGHVYGLNKDGGLKVRFVYAPFRIFQLVLNPLYAALKAYAYTLPNLWIWDQEEGRQAVKNLMAQENMYAIDLKSATDTLPWASQFDLLLQLFPAHRHLIHLTDEIVKGVWITPYKGYIQHHKGQPMGLQVSFLAFTIYLWHLLYEVCPGRFAIVGDDIVVPFDLIDHVYGLNFLTSPDKSFGGDYTEFCGTVISSTRVFQVSRLKHTNDALSLVRKFGYGALKLIPRRFHKVVKAVCRLPEPVGLGRKPLRNYRASQLIDFYDKLDTPPTLLRYPTRLNTEAKKEIGWVFTKHPLTKTVHWETYTQLVQSQYLVRATAHNAVNQHLEMLALPERPKVEGLLRRIYGLPPVKESSVMQIPDPVIPQDSSSFSINYKDLLMKYNKFVKHSLAGLALISLGLGGQVEAHTCHAWVWSQSPMKVGELFTFLHRKQYNHRARIVELLLTSYPYTPKSKELVIRLLVEIQHPTPFSVLGSTPTC